MSKDEDVPRRQLSDRPPPVAAAEARPRGDSSELERELVRRLAANPRESLALLVGTGAALLYWAEKGRNRGIRTYWDALHYVATSVSVGYANIFPQTPLGKTIGSLAMMIGPALSARALDVGERPVVPAAPALPPHDASALSRKLDEILAELRRLGTPR